MKNKDQNLIRHRNRWLVCFAASLAIMFSPYFWIGILPLMVCGIYAAFITSYPCPKCNQPIGAKLIRYSMIISYPTGKCRHCDYRYW